MSASETSDSVHIAHVQQLFVRELVPLRGMLRALVRERTIVDDLVQDTFLTVTAKAASFNEGTNFRAWLFTIARFKVLECYRKSKAPSEALRREVVESLAGTEPEFDVVDERIGHLTACIDRLAPKAKRAIELRYQRSLRPPEIASAMQWTTGAVKVALTRARDTLRHCIESRSISKSFKHAPKRLDALLDAYFDGTLSPSEKRELEQRLLDSAEDRSRFWQVAEWDALLSEWGEEAGCREPGVPDPSPAGEPVRPRYRLVTAALLGPWVVGLVGFIFVALVAWLQPVNPDRAPQTATLSASQRPQMATLVSTINARWSDDATELSLTTGEDPTGRILRLLEGTAEFRTLKGASVLVEGPAAMRFEGATSIYVESGKVVCRCPTPESRLMVNTAQTRVVDLGTEFTVEARKDQSTRVAVLSGEVKVGPDHGATHLRKGEAAEVQTKGVTLLSPDEVKKMLRSFDQELETPESEHNWLKNGSFDGPNKGEWTLTGKHVSVEDGALRVSSEYEVLWPNARQNIWRDDLSGRVYAASVRAMKPADDPLQPLQFAVLKINFIDKHRKVIAYAAKYFSYGGEEDVGVFMPAQVAAIAPAGTKGVSVELLINARLQHSGTVIFDDAVLRVGDLPTDNVSNK